MVRLLLDRPRLFFAIVAVGLGVLGSLGLLRSRYGSQFVPAGAIGFAYGVALGLFAALVFFVLRPAGLGKGWPTKLMALAGAAAILGLFLLIAR